MKDADSMKMTMTIDILEHEQARNVARVAELATGVFDGFETNSIEQRLPTVLDPVLITARDQRGWLGFKFGYRHGSVFYSWLGGVHPRARRRGVGARLMAVQHEHVRSLGFPAVTTRTRATNRPMLILNLRSGFEIVGFEINHAGYPVVSQRKALA